MSNPTPSTSSKELSSKENKSHTGIEILYLTDAVDVLSSVIDLLEDKLYNILVSDKMEEVIETSRETASKVIIPLASDIRSVRKTLNNNIGRLEKLTTRLEN